MSQLLPYSRYRTVVQQYVLEAPDNKFIVLLSTTARCACNNGRLVELLRVCFCRPTSTSSYNEARLNDNLEQLVVHAAQ